MAAQLVDLLHPARRKFCYRLLFVAGACCSIGDVESLIDAAVSLTQRT